MMMMMMMMTIIIIIIIIIIRISTRSPFVTFVFEWKHHDVLINLI